MWSDRRSRGRQSASEKFEFAFARRERESRPQHGIVFGNSGNNMIAGAQPAVQHDIQAIGAATGKDDLPRVLCADQPRNTSPGRGDDPSACNPWRQAAGGRASLADI